MTARVIIACRLPNGIMAQVGETRMRLNGANAENAVAGYGFTSVPEEFAEAWLAPASEGRPAGEGARRTVTRREGIFVEPDMGSARDRARDMAGERSGFERLDPNKPVPGITPTDETKKELAKNEAAADAERGTGGRGRGRPRANAG